jgi:tetratricopeptide (TPR) repeat protein
VSGGKRRRRRVRPGEFSPAAELLRQLANHPDKASESNAQALIAAAYERMQKAQGQAESAVAEAPWAEAKAYRASIVSMLAALPRHLEHPEELVAAWAERIIGAAGTHYRYTAKGLATAERPAEAIEALKKLAKAARELGPLAQDMLHQSASLLDQGLRPSRVLLVDKIETAIEALGPHVSKGDRGLLGRDLARQIARAYAEITGELPPTTHPDQITGKKSPYHMLVQQAFEHFGQDGWKDNARKAARRLHLEAE